MHSPTYIADLLRAHGRTTGRLYDASCGHGGSSNLFRGVGFDVTCSNYSGRPKLDPGIAFVEGVDLNLRTPFEDGSFDCAVLQEVIEHLENPAHVVREFNRILKPGGWWVLTTPNALCLRSRLHFLLTGFVKGRRRPANYNLPPGDYTNLFIPSFAMLHYLLWMYGFRIVGTGHSNRKTSSRLLLPLLWPFVWLWTRAYTRPPAAYDSPLQHEACADVRRWMLSPHFLLDENLVLLCEKRGSAKELYAPR